MLIINSCRYYFTTFIDGVGGGGGGVATPLNFGGEG